MDLNTFIVCVFCLIDDRIKGRQRTYRSRGPTPKLSDSEVITMEIVAEFLGIDTDKKGIYTYFKRHYKEWVSHTLRNPSHHLHPSSSQPVGDQGASLAAFACP